MTITFNQISTYELTDRNIDNKILLSMDRNLKSWWAEKSQFGAKVRLEIVCAVSIIGDLSRVPLTINFGSFGCVLKFLKLSLHKIMIPTASNG